MTDDRSLERAARSWLEIGPTQAPERAIDAALLLIDTTPQERDWHVPWRLPRMTTPIRIASAAVIGVFVVGGAVFALNPTPGPGSSGPSPTPSPMTAVAYAAAYGRICTDASSTLEPLKEEMVGVFDDSLTEDQRLTWIAALESFGTGYEDVITKLEALSPPAVLADDHVKVVDDYKQLRTIIADVAALLADRRYIEAQAADESANPIGDSILAWENRHGLRHCP